MPRYNYYCNSCEQVSVYRLGINEEPNVCVICHSTGSLSKTFSNSTFVSNSNIVQVESKVGDLTKKYIEDNRKILEEQIKEAKKEEYEPS
tara:strand:- start:578 stop:847 length:270 start_codon:yes stop_codon:yes gene_type:complete